MVAFLSRPPKVGPIDKSDLTAMNLRGMFRRIEETMQGQTKNRQDLDRNETPIRRGSKLEGITNKKVWKRVLTAQAVVEVG